MPLSHIIKDGGSHGEERDHENSQCSDVSSNFRLLFKFGPNWSEWTMESVIMFVFICAL